MKMPVSTTLAIGLVLSACGLESNGVGGGVETPVATTVSSVTEAMECRSQLYPYSLVLPEGWTALSSSIDEDYFESADHLSRLTIGTGTPKPGQTVEDRVRQNRTQFAACDTDERQDRPIQIDGERGVLWSVSCEGRYSLLANTIHDGLGYRLRVEVPAGAEEEAGRIMEQLLAGFAFTE